MPEPPVSPDTGNNATGAPARSALLQLAAEQRRAGQIPGAVETLKRAETLYPAWGGLFAELGFCCLASSSPLPAITAFERAVALNPYLLEAWSALQGLYGAQGRQSDERRAAGQVAALSNLPGALRTAFQHYLDGELKLAAELVHQHVAAAGEHVEALRLMAKLAAETGAPYDAERFLRRATTLEPWHETARQELATVLLRRHKHAAACEESAKLLELSPGNRAYRTLHATALTSLGDYRQALPLYAQLLQENPRETDLYVAIGDALRAAGKPHEAADSYQLALGSRTVAGRAFWALASLGTHRFTEQQIAQMQQGANDESAAPESRYHHCFALGRALTDRGVPEAARPWYDRGNALKKATIRFRPRALRQTIAQQIATSTAEFFAAHSDFGCASDAPILVVGLPHSGSAWIETLLGNHSRVDAVLQLAHIPRLVRELHSSAPQVRTGYPALLTAERSRQLGEAYLLDAQAYRNGATLRRFVDSTPHNFLYLDLVQLILPNARIIDVRRDPQACSHAIYQELFATDVRFAYSLEDIASYYQAYIELMTHWDRVLPGKIMHLRYEDMIRDFEAVVRRLLDFCGLDFEPTCTVRPAPLREAPLH
jgi:tetratricopeptide (TPR) repeat protein